MALASDELVLAKLKLPLMAVIGASGGCEFCAKVYASVATLSRLSIWATLIQIKCPAKALS